MGLTVQANDGAMLPLNSLFQTFTYDGDFLSMIEVYYAGQTYQQFFENDGTNITYISGWINPNYPVENGLMADIDGTLMVDITSGDLMTLTPGSVGA